jgi:serine/threonine-protein kinase
MVIQGRYELRKLLGQGGMGSVWAAWHRGLRVEVALKFIDASGANHEEMLNRFTHEAGAVARIKSPHVVSVMDHGFDEEHQLPFIAMEMLVGEDLLGRIERESRLPIRETVEIIRQGLRGLAKVHEAGVVHRDIKPDNLFLCQDDELLVKLLDFGIAKAELGQNAALRTGAGAILGTPAYMSPEQARGTGAVDHRSDLYSMGVVAFHAMIGQPPFESVGLGELLLMINSSPIPSPRALRDEISPALEAWFQRALAKTPEDRFQTAREMSQALVATQEGEAPSATISRQMMFSSLPEAFAARGQEPPPAPTPAPESLLPAAPESLLPAAPSVAPPAPAIGGATVSPPPPRLLGWVLAGAGVGGVLLAGALGLSNLSASRGGASLAASATMPRVSAETAAPSAPPPASELVPPGAPPAPSASSPLTTSLPAASAPSATALASTPPAPTPVAGPANPQGSKTTGRTKTGGASTRAPIDDLSKLNITRK